MLIPIAILGLFAGMKSSSLLKEKTVRRMMAVLLILCQASRLTLDKICLAVCACLKNGRILIQNGRKNVLQKYKMHYNDMVG